MMSFSQSLRSAARRSAVAMQLRRPFSMTPTFATNQPELGLGELEGAKFKIEPVRRTGEDDNTKRARLVYQSRKRGCLESDLILSTFAAQHLSTLSPELLDAYDRFLDENDWDIYYWATQKEEDKSNPAVAESPASATSPANTEDEVKREPPSGEWAQTIGNFKPAYRPVPTRWRDSEILARLRDHVRSRSVDGGEGRGMAFMPDLESR